MASLSSIYNSIRIELPGIPEPVLVDGVRKAVQEFFRKSESWRFTMPNLLDWTIALPFPDLTPDLPALTRVSRVDAVKYASDGTSLKEVPFRTKQQLDREYPDWEIKEGSDVLRWTTDVGLPRIVPIATANVTASLQVRVILAPLDTIAIIPDFLYYEYQDDFKHGTLSRLMKIPGKDWTNLAASAVYESMFQKGCVTAKSRANAEYGQPCRITEYGGI